MSGSGGGAGAGAGAAGSGAVLKDYLEKQQLDAKKKTWTKRWFVLEGNKLSYYETHKSKNPKDSFVLQNGSVACDVEKLTIEVRTDAFARAFRAKSAQAFREWVRFCVQRLIEICGALSHRVCVFDAFCFIFA